MSKQPKTCRADESMVAAARILWDHDCGAVPVVDDAGRPVGIVTDRDACMAVYTRGQRFDEMSVRSAMAKSLFTVRADDDVEQAISVMQQHQVRRLPVVDDKGRLCGLLSIADALRAANGGNQQLKDRVLAAVTAVSSPRPPAKSTAKPAVAAAPTTTPATPAKTEAPAVVVPKAQATPSAPAPANANANANNNAGKSAKAKKK